MESDKVCPHCKGDLQVWTNKRKRREYGRCKNCKKVVTLGEANGEEKSAAPEKPKAASRKTSTPAHRTGRVKRASKPASGAGTNRPVLRTGQDIPEPAAKPRGILDSFREFFNREW